jgi:hypothetical protein
MSRLYSSLTQVQVEILRWVASLGAVTAEALALRLGVTTLSARARLTSLHHRGLLERERPFAKQPALFTVTRAGLRAGAVCGIDPCRVSSNTANHLTVCAAVAAVLEHGYPDHRLIGERELRREERERGRSIASAEMGPSYMGHARLHRPDFVLLASRGEGDLGTEGLATPASAPQAPRPVAVEVELTVKAPAQLLAICRAWARCRTVAGVLYIVSPPVERALARALTEVRAEERIVVVPLQALRAEPSQPAITFHGGRL